MAIRVTLDKAPTPQESMLLHLAKMALAGAAGGAAVLWAFVVMPWWLIGLVVPSISPAAVAQGMGMSEDDLFARFPWVWVAAGFAGLMLWSVWRQSRWRASHNRLGIQQMTRRLKRHRRKAGGAVTGRTKRGVALVFAGLMMPVLLIGVNAMLGEAVGMWLERHNVMSPGWTVAIFFALMLGLIAAGSTISGSAVPVLRFWAARGTAFVLEWLPLPVMLMTGAATLAAAGIYSDDPGLPPWLANSLFPAALVATVAASWLAYRATGRLRRRYARWINDASLPDAREVRRADRRAPILYLRSFHDDRAVVITEDSVQAEIKHALRIEDLLAQEAARFGPVIAVGQPHTAVRSGAARAYFADSEWQAAVAGWVEEAQFVIIVAGFTQGVSWELERVLTSGHAAKLVVVFPPRDPHFEARWGWLQEHCRRHATAFLPGKPVAGAIMVSLDRHSDELVLTSAGQHTGQYRAALTLALHEVYRL